MRKLVVQIHISDFKDDNPKSSIYLMNYQKEMYETSRIQAEKYAKKVGADFYCIESRDAWPPGINKHPTYQKFAIYDLIDSYDQILYIDSDYIIKDHAPDLFKEYGLVSAVCIEIDEEGREWLSSRIGIPTEKYFNAGFMYLTRQDLLLTKDILAHHDIEPYTYEDCFDQSIFNKIFFEAGVSLTYLDAKLWNASNRVWAEYGDHYSGWSKNLWDASRYSNQ